MGCACTGLQDCAVGQSCLDCVCVDPSTTTVADPMSCEPGQHSVGAFGDCVNAPDLSACGRADALCLVDDFPPSFGSCSAPCESACDCPPPPASGTAQSICSAGYTGESVCALDCSGGARCPFGMLCIYDTFCSYVAVAAVAEPYGACLNEAEGCANGGCVAVGGSGTEADPNIGACFSTCDSISDCPEPPRGGSVACGVFPLSSGAEVGLCYLDCTNSDCPDGMTCASGVCGWAERPADPDASTSSGTSEGASESGAPSTEEGSGGDQESASSGDSGGSSSSSA